MKVKGYIYAIISAFLFALVSIVGKIIFNIGIHPIKLAVLQMIVTALSGWTYVLIFKRDKINIKNKVYNVIAQGLIGSALVTIFFYKALYLVSSSVAVMLLFISPVFVMLYFKIFRNKKIGSKNLIALLLTLFGSTMVINIYGISGSKINIIGIIYGILSSVSYAFLNVNAEENLSEVDSFVLVSYSSAIASIFLLLIYGPAYIFEVKMNVNLIMVLGQQGIISGLIPVILVYNAIKYIGASKVSIIGTLELPITAILGFAILDERLTLIQILGVILVLIGIMKIER